MNGEAELVDRLTLIVRLTHALHAHLIVEDDAYALAQGKDPTNVTLDGQFNMAELARVALAELERTHTLVPKPIGKVS
jgi:hypothetical protein